MAMTILNILVLVLNTFALALSITFYFEVIRLLEVRRISLAKEKAEAEEEEEGVPQ